ncbi:ClbS/DfsB family four-helix bundle protein [Lawsonibacter faecis]|mgnify:FL=1|uniref:ClbS/DfsB family four-helix bundle protein n=1 Tax=Lawsonibacter faecis TaxID=2763052 RepID=A0A8J6MDA9_9FIRM|nr:ClbS/DfsB family four-helix bundle protein [Lawsonibacter faecis]MBC5737419.1 ClbS/DfsB family four-helix bundle protein [Lawsonibacter faecis]
MREYEDKEALIGEIEKTAALFLQEFDDVSDADGDLRLEGVDKTPREMLAYQLGWMELIRGWDRDEAAGKTVVTPAPGYKWNQMGALYGQFYSQYGAQSLTELGRMFSKASADMVEWLCCFTDEELFVSGGRKWAQSTPSGWPVWKWVHMNTAAPFKTFRSKARKWKKLRAALHA